MPKYIGFEHVGCMACGKDEPSPYGRGLTVPLGGHRCGICRQLAAIHDMLVYLMKR